RRKERRVLGRELGLVRNAGELDHHSALLKQAKTIPTTRAASTPSLRVMTKVGSAWEKSMS
ncbi:MAG: hypothetical protein AAF171_22120, partial [Cyanobacteria bacterium P01_A01_bin.116]